MTENETVAANKEEEDQPRKVGRPRSAESHQAILDATLVLVAQEGIRGASIEAIAARAGVGENDYLPTVEHKEDLVLDALSSKLNQADLIDTGNFREDLIRWLYDILRLKLSDPLTFQIALRVFGEAASYPGLVHAIFERGFAPRVNNLVETMARAQARGDLDPNLDPVFVSTLFSGPLVFLTILPDFFPDFTPIDNVPEKIVDTLLRGIKARP